MSNHLVGEFDTVNKFTRLYASNRITATIAALEQDWDDAARLDQEQADLEAQD